MCAVYRFYSPIVAPGSVPLLFYPPVLPKINVEFNAMVAHVNSPSDFYVQQVGVKAHIIINS